MAAPFLIYFAGVGTVVAALGIGFGGGWVLSSSEPNGPRGKPPTIAKQEPPPLSSTPVTVRTPDENKAQAKAEEIKRAAEPSSVETSSAEKSTEPRPEPATDGRASPGANWVAMPPETTGPATATTPATTAPVRPLTSPLTPPPASPETAAPATAAPSAPTTTVTVRRGSDPTAAEERVTVKREPGGRGSIEIRVADEFETRPQTEAGRSAQVRQVPRRQRRRWGGNGGGAGRGNE